MTMKKRMKHYEGRGKNTCKYERGRRPYFVFEKIEFNIFYELIKKYV